MADQAQSSGAASAQASTAASPALGEPGSDLRWLLPILLCLGVLVILLPLAVFMPLGQTVEVSFQVSNAGDQPLRFSQAPYIEVLEGC